LRLVGANPTLSAILGSIGASLQPEELKFDRRLSSAVAGRSILWSVQQRGRRRIPPLSVEAAMGANETDTGQAAAEFVCISCGKDLGPGQAVIYRGKP
jgi:hypothetical protein